MVSLCECRKRRNAVRGAPGRAYWMVVFERVPELRETSYDFPAGSRSFELQGSQM